MFFVIEVPADLSKRDERPILGEYATVTGAYRAARQMSREHPRPVCVINTAGSPVEPPGRKLDNVRGRNKRAGAQATDHEEQFIFYNALTPEELVKVLRKRNENLVNPERGFGLSCYLVLTAGRALRPDLVQALKEASR